MYKKHLELDIDCKYLADILEILEVCDANDIDAFLCGGCVRDMLLGKAPKDYDICYETTPAAFIAAFADTKFSVIPTGLRHGTVTLHSDETGNSFECTATRSDGGYGDHRHPDSVEFTRNLEEDLRRRDFTINSFAYDLRRQELLMPDEAYINDLDYGIVKAVGDPDSRFAEDALRMLRAFRFVAQLNFSLDSATFNAIKGAKQLLAKVSKERIRDELTKILMSDNPQVLELVVAAGLEPYIFDGVTPLTDCINCDHENPWHYTDVFHHTMDVIKRVPKTFELRWAALFHDFGKPAVKQLKAGTTDHYSYHGHQDVSAEMALGLMEILKFSNDQKDLIYKFVKYHDADLAFCRNATFNKALADIGVCHFRDFIKLRLADAMAHRLTKDTKWAIDAIDAMYKRFDKAVADAQALTVKDLAINGYDVTADGFLRGREIGECLRWMLDIVMGRPEYNTREKLLELLQEFKEMSFQAS